MPRNFRELRNMMSQERRETNVARAKELLASMPLQQLRQARELSQQQISLLMDTTQGEISKIEHRADVYVSTLRSYIEAMGGELHLIARFPEGEYQITQFGDTDVEPKRRKAKPTGKG